MHNHVIDPDITSRQLITQWKAGEHKQVIRALASDHPGLAALLLVQGFQDKQLKLTDLNHITNELVDLRKAATKKQLVCCKPALG